MDKSDNLSLTIHGHVRIAEFPEETNVCVKMHTVPSGDWKLISGDSVQLSSFSYRGPDNQLFVDLPFECSMKGSTPFMWPRLVFNCFSKDSSDKDCVTGYGSLPIPTEPGKHKRRVYCFLPENSSMMQSIIAKLRKMHAEFVDPLLPATSEGRYACRTSTKGYLDIEMNVSIKSLETGCKFTSSPSENKANSAVPLAISELAATFETGKRTDDNNSDDSI